MTLLQYEEKMKRLKKEEDYVMAKIAQLKATSQGKKLYPKIYPELPWVDKVFDDYCKEIGFSREILTCRCQQEELNINRYPFYDYLHNYKFLTLGHIGYLFGGRHHSTIIHGIKAYEFEKNVYGRYSRQKRAIDLLKMQENEIIGGNENVA